MLNFPQVVIPIGAVLAAAITAAASFVRLVVAKDQKVSEFRQAWIDGLRMELAEFASNARRLSSEERPIDLRRIGGTLLETITAHNEEVLRADPFHDNRLKMAEAYYTIRLRLNPDEPDHTAIFHHMNVVYEVLSTESSSTCFEKTVVALDSLSIEAQRVLKREWVRVRDGEVTYRKAIRIAKVMGIALAVCLAALLVYAFALSV